MADLTRPALALARDRLGGMVAIGCAVAFGAALVTATGVVAETGLVSHPPTGRLADADLVVTAPRAFVQDEDFDIALPEAGTVDLAVADRIAELPGVTGTAVDVSFPVAILGADGPTVLTGHGWQIAALSPASGPGPGDGEVVVTADTARATGLAAGDIVDFTAAGIAQRATVAAVAPVPGDGLYLPQDEALTAAGHGPDRVELVAVTVSGDVEAVAERIAANVDGVEVVTGARIGDLADPQAAGGAGPLTAMAASLAGTIVMIVGFMVAAALAVTVAGQRRDLALLRAVGATPRQIRRLVATQTALVTAVGLPPGIAIGYLLAGGFGTMLTDLGVMSTRLPLSRGPVPGLAAAVLLAAATQLAARAAALRPSRMSATEAVRESRVEPRSPGRARVIAGHALLGLSLTGSIVPLLTRSEAAFVSSASTILLAMLGLGLAAPALVRAVTGWIVARLRPRGRVETWLAMHHSHAHALRMAGAVTVLALAVGFTVTQAYSRTTLEVVTAEEATAGMRADQVVTRPGGLSTEDSDRAAELPGVAETVALRHSVALLPYREDGRRRAEELSLTVFSAPPDRVLDLDVADGDLARLTGDTVAMDSATAWANDITVGDRVELVLADGTAVTPTVVATYRRGFGYGRLVAAGDLVADATGIPVWDAVLVADDGCPDCRDRAADALRDWAAERPGATVGTTAADAGFGGDDGAADRWINLAVSLALLGYVLLGVGNSMVAATARRRGELSLLRLLGATGGQLLATLRRESALMAGLAVTTGLVLSVLPMSVLGAGLTGRPWPQGPLWVIPAIAALVSLLAHLAVMVPARRALRVPPGRVE